MMLPLEDGLSVEVLAMALAAYFAARNGLPCVTLDQNFENGDFAWNE